MEDAVHCSLNGMVVGVDWFRVERATGGTQRLGGCEQGLDGLVSEHHQRGDRPKTGWGCLVAPAVADPANDLFAAQFLQVIGGVARAVGEKVLLAEQAHPSGGAWWDGLSSGRAEVH